MTKWLGYLVLFCALMTLWTCTVDSEGAANLLLSNLSTMRVLCKVDDGLGVSTYWVESLEEKSLLLDMGEYRVKIELYRGGQAVSARLYTLSLTQVARVHQIVIENNWADGGGGS